MIAGCLRGSYRDDIGVYGFLVPTEDSNKTQSVSSGQTAHPQDTEGHIQPTVKGSHSPISEGTIKSQPLPKSKKSDPQDSEGNKHPADMGLLATHPDERLKPLVDRDSSTPPVTALLGIDAKYQVDQTQSTRFKVLVPDQNKGKTSSEVESDTKTLLLTTVADIQALLVDSDEELKDDNDDVFKAGEEMDEDIQEPETKETQTHHSNETPTEEPLSTKHQSPSPHPSQRAT
ncbi:hypothetical protein Tco_0836571 [Tanacetum coccineum]